MTYEYFVNNFAVACPPHLFGDGAKAGACEGDYGMPHGVEHAPHLGREGVAAQGAGLHVWGVGA